MSEQKRPYPDGICWDEAWRQRQRAEKALLEVDRLTGIYDYMVARSSEQTKLIAELERQLRLPLNQQR
jgi:hypothetical protein